MGADPTRRGAVLGAGALVGALASPAIPSSAWADADALSAIELAHGGRLGVHAIDLGNGRSLTLRADERFLMCSTFKVLLVAAVLARVEGQQERLDRMVGYSEKDLLGHSPVTRAHVAEGKLSVEALCAAAIQESDNGATNLLLASLEGPAGVTRYVRGLGDTVTRLDRNEMTLNTPSGILDTTTPRAVNRTLGQVLFGQVLSDASRDRIEYWMQTETPGLARIRAGLPQGWVAGDKPGTAGSQCNDLAVVRPPGRAPIMIAAFYDAPDLDDAGREAVLKAVGAAVSRWVRSNS
jgi:beta-lactamase class A